MTRSAVLVAFLLASACSVQLTGEAGHVCNTEHACPAPLACVASVCVSGSSGDGGGSSFDDAGIRWEQAAHGFTGTTVGTGCSADVDAANSNELDTRVFSGAGVNFAWGDVMTGLPQASQGRLGGWLQLFTKETDELRVLRVLNGSGDEMLSVYLLPTNTLELHAAAGTLGADEVSEYPEASAYPDLAPLFSAAPTKLELAWVNGQSLTTFVNGAKAFELNLTALDGGTGSPPGHLELGLSGPNASVPDGGFFARYSSWGMSGNPEAVFDP